MAGTPTPAEQIRFIRQLQRILSDGAFVSTYKYALLHALADLSVIHGDDTGAPLTLGTRQIAERFIELYWRQALPFPAPASPAQVVLRQNTGQQAEIVRHLEEFARANGPSLGRARRSRPEWKRLVGSVDAVVRKMPLWKLQTVGKQRLSFLYENHDRGSEITLRPGVAYCFRAYHDLIVDLLRGAWLRFVRAQNGALLGETADLSAFLFGAPRGNLSAVEPLLTDVQSGHCFYCRRRLTGSRAIDHFVPWSRYPTDLAHNFVLTHRACNQRKADHLAGRPHLDRWLERNDRHASALDSAFREAGLSFDRPSSEGIARWAYAQVERIGGSVWVEGSDLVGLARGWEDLFLRGAGIFVVGELEMER